MKNSLQGNDSSNDALKYERQVKDRTVVEIYGTHREKRSYMNLNKRES